MGLLRKPLFKDPVVGTVVGIALLAGSWWVLYDAWEGRGRTRPIPLRPVTPW